MGWEGSQASLQHKNPTLDQWCSLTAFWHKRTSLSTMIHFCIRNSLSFKFFHFYLSFVIFQCPLSSCRWVQLWKMLWTYTVQSSRYLRQKSPANPQFPHFCLCSHCWVASLFHRPPATSSSLSSHPVICFCLLQRYSILSSQTVPRTPLRTLARLCHLLLSTPCLLHHQGSPCALPPPPEHPPWKQGKEAILATGVGSSRGNLATSKQGAKDTDCRTAQDSIAGGHEGQVHQEPHPWARVGTSSGAVAPLELREASERRQSSPQSPSSHWINSGRIWPAIFFSAASKPLKFLQQQKYSSNPLYFTWCDATHNTEDHMSSCLFFTWLEWPNNSLGSLQKHFNKYHGLCLEEMGELLCRRKALGIQVH